MYAFTDSETRVAFFSCPWSSNQWHTTVPESPETLAIVIVGPPDFKLYYIAYLELLLVHSLLLIFFRCAS